MISVATVTPSYSEASNHCTLHSNIGIQTIALIRATENYEEVSKGFEDCFRSINYHSDSKRVYDAVL